MKDFSLHWDYLNNNRSVKIIIIACNVSLEIECEIESTQHYKYIEKKFPPQLCLFPIPGESDSKVVENSRDHETNSSEVGDEAPIEMKISRETDEKPNIHIETIESKLSKPPPTNKKKSPYKDKAKNGDGNQSGNIEWKKSLKKRPLTLLEKVFLEKLFL